ncbi:MAG: serine/threonine-protein kinase [Gemmatimonadota bacterium]
MLQTCRRVGAVALVFAGLWTIALLFNSLAARLMGHLAIIEAVWPYPGVPIALVGLAASLIMTVLAWKLSDRPHLLLDISAGFLVFVCFLAALLTQWLPSPVTPRISWLCVMILSYPAIVPSSPARTRWVTLLAASMDPLALYITHLRGVPIEPGVPYLLWAFLPTYACALISVVPSRIIRSLGQQVRHARELGSYRLEEVLGKGGMGEVYRATHQMLARPAAVKLIRPEILGKSSADGALVIIERFRREAEATASLRSPHTISLYDFGATEDGTFFLVMELLDGLDLQSMVERFGPLPPDRVAYLMRQACDSLAEAHSRGLIHRDVKPSNIFACRMGLQTDFVKVLDFGLVKAQDQSSDDLLITAPEATAGTPAYIAPEVVRGDVAIDHRVDIYALGCVAYWLLTGKLVFEAPNAVQLMIQHSQAVPVPPSQRIETPIPAAFDAVVLACLAKRPDDRPADATDLSRRFGAAVEGEGWTEEKAQRWWHRHHPDGARKAATACALTLTKTMGPGWTPATEEAPVTAGQA